MEILLGPWLWKIVEGYATPQFTISSMLLHDLRLVYRWSCFQFYDIDQDDHIPGRAFTDLFRSEECKRIIAPFSSDIRVGGSKWNWFTALRIQLCLWAAPYYSKPLLLDAPKLNLLIKNEVIRSENTNGWYSIQEVFALSNSDCEYCDLYLVPSISDVPTIQCHVRRIPWSIGMSNAELWLDVDEYRDRKEEGRRTPRECYIYDHLQYRSPNPGEKLMYGSDGMHGSVFKKRTRSRSVGTDSRTEHVRAVRYDTQGNIWRIV